MKDKRKTACQCTRCKSTFDIKDTSIVPRSLYGLTIKEKRCPVCKGEFRQLNVDGYYERNRDAWYLKNPLDSNLIMWTYFNREN